MRFPDIHENRVAFVCEGDIWIGDLRDGRAVRLTSDVGRETTPRFSPYGKWIAFSGEYDGTREVYVTSVDGGAPRRVTYFGDLAEPQDWSPDGKEILVRARGFPISYRLFRVPAEGGFPTALPIEFASHACFLDQNRIAFTRFQRSEMAWFGYEGGRVNAIWIGDLNEMRFEEVLKPSKGSAEFPAAVGPAVWGVADADGKYGLRNQVGSSTPASDAEIRNLASDGKRLIYERGMGLEMFEPATKRTVPLRFELTSDLIHTRPYRVPAERFLQGATVGPTGRRVLAVARGQIVSLPTKEGDVRIVLAKPGIRYRLASFSPDGERIAFVSDESGEQQVYVAKADGADAKVLTNDMKRQVMSLQWSPDGRNLLYGDSEGKTWLIDVPLAANRRLVYDRSDPWEGARAAFSPDSNWIVFEALDPITHYKSIALYDVKTGTTHHLGPRLANDYAPTFATDGRWIAFLSRRHLAPAFDEMQNSIVTRNTAKVYLLSLDRDALSPLHPRSEEEPTKAEEPTPPKPFKIDLPGLYDRLIELPAPPRNYSRIEIAGDRVLLQYVEDSTTKLAYLDLKDKSQGQVAESFQRFELSADGKKVLLYGAAIRVVDVTATNVPATPTLGFGSLQLEIAPRSEWEQIFWDAWRLHRDFFYVKNMHGADWPKVGQKYAAMLPAVRSRDELDLLLRWMQAELNCSHAYLSPGDTRSTFRPNPPGFLGIDVEPDPSGYYRITRILRGDGFAPEASPLASPGLKVDEGHFLIEVAGRPARVGSPFLEGLVGRAGQIVGVKVNDRPTAEGARLLHVRPLASERNLRYREWVKDNLAYVERRSKGRIAYLHMQNMGTGAFGHFVQQYFPQRNKEALIVDVRFNSGGNVSDYVARILNQKFVVHWNQRSGPVWSRQGDTFDGPMACLINEYSFSDGEEFPDQFRQMRLGALIGMRTTGGEVGSDPGWPLIDGGSVSVPNYGAFRPGGQWVIESEGVIPEREVPSDPNAFAQGRDAQLDAAIDHLLLELELRPVKRPVPPPDPVRARGGK